MISQEESKLFSFYLDGTIDIISSFKEVAEVLTEGGNAIAGKVVMKQKLAKLLVFAKEVYGPDELTEIARPYITLKAKHPTPS